MTSSSAGTKPTKKHGGHKPKGVRHKESTISKLIALFSSKRFVSLRLLESCVGEASRTTVDNWVAMVRNDIGDKIIIIPVKPKYNLNKKGWIVLRRTSFDELVTEAFDDSDIDCGELSPEEKAFEDIKTLFSDDEEGSQAITDGELLDEIYEIVERVDNDI